MCRETPTWIFRVTKSRSTLRYRPNLSPCCPWRHVEGVGVWRHLFLISVLYRCQLSASCPGHISWGKRARCTHWWAPMPVRALQVKGKVQLYPRIGHKDPARKYNSTLSLTSAIDGGRWSTPRPGHFIHDTHCIGGWVGPRAGLDGCGKSRHHRDSIPWPSSL